MFKKMVCIFSLLISFSAFSKSIALSFDDGLDPATNEQAKEINDAILQALKSNHIQAIVFPSLSKTGGDAGLKLIEDWGMRGHKIGNHANLHLNLNKNDVTLEEYLVDMQQGHQAFSKMQGFVPRYRFPFLKEGNTLAKRDGVRSWLKENQYQSGAVTIDASDWYYNQLFLKFEQQNDQENLNKLKQAYIFHLLDRAQYYEGLAQQTLGRSPHHVLLLHVRAINAAWLKDVITAFKANGWTFVESDRAYQDPIYQIQTNILPAGESLVWNIANVYGIASLRYPAEDAPYEQDTLKKFGLLIEP